MITKSHSLARAVSPEVVVRFWGKAAISGAASCWRWCAALDADGYGRFLLHRKNRKAHRVAVALVRGPIPEGHTVDHLCENRACVNPLHLEVVTHAENMRRMGARRTHCAHGHLLSETSARVSTTGRLYCAACKRSAETKRKRRNRHTNKPPP